MTDPVTAEIIRSYFDTVANQVFETLCRTSPNPMVNEAKDCSAGLFGYDGNSAEVVALAGIVGQSYALATSVQAGLKFFRGDLHPGDALLVGDPYHGGTHCGCWTVVVPIFFNGRPRFLTATRLHVLDQGSPSVGPVNNDCREIWQEGLRLPPIKLFERGERRRDVWEWLASNSRIPDLVEADVDAMIGSCRVGERAIHDLVDKHGLDVVEDSLEWIFDYSERKFRNQIQSWPDGIYTSEFYVDSDFAGSYDLKVHVAVTIDDDHISFDFAGSDEQTAGFVNSALNNSAAYVGIVLTALCPGIPFNAGFFRAFSVELPEGSIVNPTAPAPTLASTLVSGCQIGQAVMKACEQFTPESVTGVTLDATGPYVYGFDTREQRVIRQSQNQQGFYIFMDIMMVGMSSSAVHGADGWGMWATTFSASSPLNVEVTELQAPVHYLEAELSMDSAAPGQWRGTPALVLRRLDRGARDPRASFLVQSLVHPLPGWVGGYEGAGNFIVLNEGSENEMIAGEHHIGDVAYDPTKPILAQSGGGGGWGSPLDREPDAVLQDIIDEFVSIDGARADYGVIIDPDSLTVNVDETGRERARILAAPEPRPLRGIGRERTIARTGIAHRVDQVSPVSTSSPLPVSV